MTGADLLCAALHAAGVEWAIGVPGSQNIGLYDALRRSRLRTVLTTHELAASFMANGVHRASGKVAAVVTIPGPGFTYALTGLAEARHDSAAVVHLVGEPATSARGFPFQAVDQRAMAAPIVKEAFRIQRAEDIPGVVRAAVECALSGEPGPVLVEWSSEAVEGAAPSGVAPEEARPRRPARVEPAALEEIAAAIQAARRPLIVAGQGCADASAPLIALAERLSAPVLTTASGRGVIPEDHPLALGFDFSRGDVLTLNEVIRRSDCVLALGCKLTWAGTCAFELDLPADRLIHVDASPEVVGATYPARLTLAAPVEGVLDHLLRATTGERGTDWTSAELATQRERVRAISSLPYEPVFEGIEPRTAEAFFAKLREALPRDTIVTTDSGLHQILARRHFPILAPRGLIPPTDFQSMGFGLPAALGAKLAAPHRPVVAIIGDGGFAMSGLELLTAVREQLPIVVVVFNDGRLNRIRLEQLQRFGATEAVDLVNPDFEGIAAALGVHYLGCDANLSGTVREAIRRELPTLIEVRMGSSASVHLIRTRGLVRSAARRALGRGVRWRWLRTLLGQSRPGGRGA